MKLNKMKRMVGFGMLWALVCFLGPSLALAGLTVSFDRPVHFLTPGGDDVVVNSGDYEVEQAENWLRLIPGERQDAVLIQAEATTHDEKIMEPVALSVPGDESDRHHVLLLLPDGTGIEAIGTYSGVRGRGFFSRLSQSVRQQAVQQPASKPTSKPTPSPPPPSSPSRPINPQPQNPLTTNPKPPFLAPPLPRKPPREQVPPTATTPVGYLEVPLNSPCPTIGSVQIPSTWIQAQVQVVTDTAPARYVPNVTAKFGFSPYSSNPRYPTDVQVFQVQTDQLGKAVVDIQICGANPGWVSISIRKKIGFYAGTGSIVDYPDSSPYYRRAAPLENSEPPNPGTVSYLKPNVPGMSITYNNRLNAGNVNGRQYASRQFLYVKVTRAPDHVVFSKNAPQSCFNFPLYTGPLKNPTGTKPLSVRLEASSNERPFASKAVLWKSPPMINAQGYRRNAIVVFEGIDGNNETPPQEMYAAVKGLRKNIHSWTPGAGDWATDVWVVDYAWGGANIKDCLIPQGKELLLEIFRYYGVRSANNMNATPVPLTVAGISMGGVVSRGALAQLDASDLNLLATLGIRAFITLDSPHQGAEVHRMISTFIKQIHRSTYESMVEKRNGNTERSYVKIWNPAANQLLFRKCSNVKEINRASDFAQGAGFCERGSLTYEWHDDFYNWLRRQGPPRSNGYPTSIPKYAVSLGLGRLPNAPPSEDYWHGKISLWAIDWDRFEEIFTQGDIIAWTRLVSGRSECDETGYQCQEIFDITNDSFSWEGRRNRRPGSRISIKEFEAEEGYFWNFKDGAFVPGSIVHYDPTFISLISALEGAAESQITPGQNNFSYRGSPFNRVWFPIEYPACGYPSVEIRQQLKLIGVLSDSTCSRLGWYHDVRDILINKNARGVDDLVGQGNDTAGGGAPSEQFVRIRTLPEFLSEVLDPRRKSYQ